MDIPTGWEIVDGARLRRVFRFPDFAGALAFVVEVGKMADEVGHHPDVALGWGRATIEWSTHDAGNKVTDKDFDAATRTNEIHSKIK
jgi:4a-hydroxytetrahydrobiopterin dehydratase